MAGSFAVDCKKVFPHCAYTLSAAVLETNLALWLAHLAKEHNGSHPTIAGPVTLLDCLTLS